MGEFWAGRRVLLTGHTGFKGSWLSLWLSELGARVTGVGLEPDTTPNLFGQLELAQRLERHHIADIRTAQALAQIVQAHWYRRTSTGGCRYLRRPRPMALRVRTTVKSGAASSLGMRLRVQH